MKVKICNELPQWIISSDKAAYHPYTKTIYIKDGCMRYIFHELGNWLIDSFLMNKDKYHKMWDRVEHETAKGIYKRQRSNQPTS
jgi:hypothetical protein